jgi:hypothetical protein
MVTNQISAVVFFTNKTNQVYKMEPQKTQLDTESLESTVSFLIDKLGKKKRTWIKILIRKADKLL